jgi:hypothetical protein
LTSYNERAQPSIKSTVFLKTPRQFSESEWEEKFELTHRLYILEYSYLEAGILSGVSYWSENYV